VSANPPPLVSPVAGFDVRAVLDQDASVTAGLALDADGERAVILVANRPCESWERAEFLAWGRSLSDIAGVARIARIAGFGCTDDGRPYLATYVTKSLADHLRRVGQPAPDVVCEIGAKVADALATVHSYGIVHGAISPATVLFGNGVRLAGFGVTAPALTGPIGVWAFTAPEHRAAAATGRQVGTPSADVFALAATMCVALAGVLPWSDPTTWADAADLPDGSKAPLWVQVLRAALSADPDLRPSAEEFGDALRLSKPAPVKNFTPRKVDLRGLIPRAARRLAANSVDAMADVVPAGQSRAVAPVERIRMRRTRTLFRNHGSSLSLTATVVAMFAAFAIYSWWPSDSNNAAANPPAPAVSASASQMAALIASARTASESFLHRVGAGDATVCTDMQGIDNITTPASASPVTCAYLMANESSLLSSTVRARLRDAHVTGAVGLSGTAGAGANETAFVSLPYVPSLENVLTVLEITMKYQGGRWLVVQVTLG
jgi:serine/threonine protein kinase